jgi:hypothetical protein
VCVTYNLSPLCEIHEQHCVWYSLGRELEIRGGSFTKVRHVTRCFGLKPAFPNSIFSHMKYMNILIYITTIYSACSLQFHPTNKLEGVVRSNSEEPYMAK